MGIGPDRPPRWPRDFFELPPDEHGRAVCHLCARRDACELLRKENRQLDTVAPYVARWRCVVHTDKYKSPPGFERFLSMTRQRAEGEGWSLYYAACDGCLAEDPRTVVSMERHPAGWSARAWPGKDREAAVADERKAVLEPLLRAAVLHRLFGGLPVAAPRPQVPPPPPGMRSWSGWYGNGDDGRLGSLAADLPEVLGTFFHAFGRITPKGERWRGEDDDEFAFCSVVGHAAAFRATAVHTDQVVTFAVTDASPFKMSGTYTSRSPSGDGCFWIRRDYVIP